MQPSETDTQNRAAQRASAVVQLPLPIRKGLSTSTLNGLAACAAKGQYTTPPISYPIISESYPISESVDNRLSTGGEESECGLVGKREWRFRMGFEHSRFYPE
jgi:hypothetical protein